MVSNLIEQEMFAVMICSINDEGLDTLIISKSDMTFIDAADYAVQAQGYFRYAIAEHDDWQSITIKVAAHHYGTVQMIQITRD